MSIRVTLITAILLPLVGGCSPSSGERATAADQMQHGKAASELPAAPPPPPLTVEKQAPPPPSVAIKDLPPDKVIAPTEGEGPLQTKLPDGQDMAVTPPPYHPLDLPPSGPAGRLAPFPQEVTNFMVERDSCDHFRGEEPYDADRRAYLAENIAELCTGTDGRLAALRMRYANNATVIAALSDYEERIESGTGSGKYIGK